MPELTSHTLVVGDENDPGMAAGQMMLDATSPNGDGQAIEFQCDSNEQKILAATLKALHSGSLTPLIKEELRCTIQSRRLAEGKGELQVEFKSPPKKKTMTEEERSRYLRRRVQNREAAQRFRQKQKDTSDLLSAKIEKLERKSRSLLTDLTRLREEKDSLKEMLKSHLVVCTNQHRIPTILSSHQLDQLLSESNNDHHTDTNDSSVYSSTSMSDCLSPSGSVSTSSISTTPPPRPGTADSSAAGSDVFFFPEETCAESLGFQDTEVEVFVTSSGAQIMNGNDVEQQQHLQSFAFSPNQDIRYVEEIVIDTSGGADLSEYQRPDSTEAMRIDSCSSVDTPAEGRDFSNSTSTFFCPNIQTSCYDNSVHAGATTLCLDNNISFSGFNHDMQMYVEEERKKEQTKTAQELVNSLVTVLNSSQNSDFDLSSLTVVHGGEVSQADGGNDFDAATGLAESTSDLRHSLAFAHSRVHDMCDLHVEYPVQDFFFQENVVP